MSDLPSSSVHEYVENIIALQPGRVWFGYFPNAYDEPGQSYPGTAVMFITKPDAVPVHRRFLKAPVNTPFSATPTATTTTTDTEARDEPPAMHPDDQATTAMDDFIDGELMAHFHGFHDAFTASVRDDVSQYFDTATGTRIAFPCLETSARGPMCILLNAIFRAAARHPGQCTPCPVIAVPVPARGFDSDAVTLATTDEMAVRYVFGITLVPLSLVRTYGLEAVLHAAMTKRDDEAFVTFLRAHHEPRSVRARACGDVLCEATETSGVGAPVHTLDLGRGCADE